MVTPAQYSPRRRRKKRYPGNICDGPFLGAPLQDVLCEAVEHCKCQRLYLVGCPVLPIVGCQFPGNPKSSFSRSFCQGSLVPTDAKTFPEECRYCPVPHLQNFLPHAERTSDQTLSVKCFRMGMEYHIPARYMRVPIQAQKLFHWAHSAPRYQQQQLRKLGIIMFAT